MKTMLLLSFLSIWSSLFGYDVVIRAVDDQGVPVPNAKATIIFAKFREGTDIAHEGTTDKDGYYKARGRAEESVAVTVSKDGHYLSRVRRLKKDTDIDLVVVSPRILNPIPLFAKQANVVIPIQNEWIGFDFEFGDWVSPHGKGQVADIRLKFSNEFQGWSSSEKKLEVSRRVNSQMSEKEFKDFYGKWSAELEVSFPGEHEGLYEETRYLDYSGLRLPHLAPLNGYVASWHYAANNYSPRTVREKIGFFLRTRVKLDQEGRIISANYAKLMGDVHLLPQGGGGLRFAFYFNPTPNDRNLEWDTDKNLLKGLANEETPKLP